MGMWAFKLKKRNIKVACKTSNKVNHSITNFNLNYKKKKKKMKIRQKDCVLHGINVEKNYNPMNHCEI